MSLNSQLSRRFEQIAAMLDLTGANSFRVSANARAARVIADYPTDFASIADDFAALTAIDGIGKGAAEKIQEFVRTGDITEHRELRAQVPAGLLEVLDVPGLGPKSVKAMWESLGVTSMADLRRILADGSIMQVPRMGEKTVENIKKALAFAATSGERTRIGLAMPLAEHFVAHLRRVKGVERCEYAGSLRRGAETIGDIDILAATAPKNAAKVAEAFTTMPEVEEVLAHGEAKCSVRAKWQKPGGDAARIQVDLRIVPPDAFGAALMYFTGSKNHNVRLRERALKMGLTLNEYGLFPEDKSTKEAPQKRGVKPVAAKTEEEIYAKLKLPYLPPEIREDRGELDFKPDSPPHLIALDDIKAELHAHTVASDGSMTLDELIAQAKQRGFHTLAVTDHSKSQVIANGLPVERLREHVKAIHAADKKATGIKVLAGSEVDILADGSLDYDEETLASLDFVVASPHAGLKADPKRAMQRLLKAVANPMVHVIGHPTGRLINRREGMTIDVSELAAAAKEHDVALEINAHWMRLDLRDIHVRAAVEAGCLIAIDTDAHLPEDFDNLRYGVMTARRGWLPPEQCINAWPAKKLHAWIKKKRA